ncbi:MAG: hypothetical protein GX660_19765 [Clostridiaceae bacterium]|nr:hypothetical protein [Clostridiaceae bacterium]
MFMSRVEKFRQIRKTRKKCFFAIIFTLILMLAGIYTVDYSLNGLMNKEEGFALVRIKPYSDNYYQVEVLGKCLYINAGYIKRDIEGIKEYFINLLAD